jgi:hypothetical protein
VIPRGFDAYARILHRASRGSGPEPQPTWAEIAAACGTELHALAQFHAIARRWQYDHRNPVGWAGENPEEGNLDLAQLGALCEVLASRDRPDRHCFLAFWDGYGGTPAAWRNGPLIQQKFRQYILFEGRLDAVVDASIAFERRHPDPGDPSVGMHQTSAAASTALDDDVEHDRERKDGERNDVAAIEWAQSPNQWWPDDHSWCVATEIDFDSTLVAGTRQLIDTVLNDPRLEAFEVQPDDDLTYGGDHINPQLPPG